MTLGMGEGNRIVEVFWDGMGMTGDEGRENGSDLKKGLEKNDFLEDNATKSW